MKTKIFTLAFLAFTSLFFAQNRSTVNASSSDISDNLDLKAVASIFGDSKNLEDFERRLNDPKLQISNLDLNNDNQVDYLRVIETVEGRTHLVVIQSVLRKDVYQDVATIEIERDRFNKVQVQVVGDEYLYGRNYIYEPVYVQTPIFYDYFWVDSYRPYYSTWNWGYYPTYYVGWNPYPIFRYRHNVDLCINVNYQYNYVNYRRSQVAYNQYNTRRANGYEREYPNRSFVQRHENIGNRYELEQTRPRTNDVAFPSPRGNANNNNPRGNSVNQNVSPRNSNTPRSSMNSDNNAPRMATNPKMESPRPNRDSDNNAPRIATNPKIESPRPNRDSDNNAPRISNNPRAETPRPNRDSENSSPRISNNPRAETPRPSMNSGNGNPRNNTPQRAELPRQNSSPTNAPRSESPRTNEENRGSRR